MGKSSVEGFAEKLPDPAELQRRCRVVSMLDALVVGKPLVKGNDGTIYHPSWRHGDDLVKYTNGGGDEWSIIFSAKAGVFVRGFVHDSELSTYNEDDYWPGLVGDLPEPFTSDLKDPDLYQHYDTAPQMTVCVWRAPTDDTWRHGTLEPTQWGYYGDGGEGLFEPLVDWQASKELDWLYPDAGHVIPEPAVQQVMNQQPLTDGLIRAFHPNPDTGALRAEARRIGY
ncbi:hypothetical protein ACFWE3_17475 [Mycobacteriaceae bacterium NPDC060252]